MLTKNATQTGDVVINGGAALDVAKGASLLLADNANINGTGTLRVDGNLGINGTGVSSIAANVILNGGINVNSGELQIMGGVTGSTNGTIVTAGSIAVHSGARLDLMSALGTIGTGLGPVINLSGGNASVALFDAPAFNGVISGFTHGDFIEITALASGVITDSLDSTGKTLTISDSANHTFTIHFAQAQTVLPFGSTGSGIEVAVGPHGYLGIFHT
jgi:hypothetical protein